MNSFHRTQIPISTSGWSMVARERRLGRITYARVEMMVWRGGCPWRWSIYHLRGDVRVIMSTGERKTIEAAELAAMAEYNERRQRDRCAEMGRRVSACGS